MTRRIVGILAVCGMILLSVLLCCCGETGETVTETATESVTERATESMTEHTFALTDLTEGEEYRVMGRSLTLDSGISMNWSCTTLEFNAYCKDNVQMTFSSDRGVAVRVYVDGKDTGLVYINAVAPELLATEGMSEEQKTGSDTVTIATGLKEGNHTFRVVKASMSESTLVAESVTICGSFTELSPAKEVYIAFYGNSLMDGFGIYPQNPEKYQFTYTASNMWRYRCYIDDATRTFSYRTALNLGVDYDYMAYSGIGWVYGGPEKQFIDIFDYVDYFNDKEAMVDFSTYRVPDLIVFTLSGNDAEHWPSDQKTKEYSDAWEKKITDFIADVRTKFGKDVPMVFVSGIFPTDMKQQMRALIKSAGGESAGLYFLMMEADTDGISMHPSEAQGKEEAEVLTEYLKKTFPELFK